MDENFCHRHFRQKQSIHTTTHYISAENE